MLTRARTVYSEYPSTFWTLISATFIDRLGGALIWPFFSLYVTQKFQVGMTEVGTLVAIFTAGSFIGGGLGGAMADKFGRKALILFGLVSSATSAIFMGLVSDLRVFYALAIFVGMFSDVGHAAHQAMVADLLPEAKRASGYGMIRVVANLAVTIGPMIGGLLAGVSYLLLFIIDAITSSVTALIFFARIPETKPETRPGQESPSFLQTLVDYRIVGRDRIYMLFILVSMLMTLVYHQMNITLPVYLNQEHGIPPRGFGYILSLNAGMVVLFQFWITRKLRRQQPLLMMALGTALYMVGFSMYGFVATFPLFLLAMVIITIGEMVSVPVSQALVARLAPEDMRGRYMAIYGYSWLVPTAIGPLAAGLIMDRFDPRWVWYAAGILAALATAGYVALQSLARRRLQEKETAPQTVPAPGLAGGSGSLD